MRVISKINHIVSIVEVLVYLLLQEERGDIG